MPAPPPWSLPFDFGLVLLAAPLAWPVVRRWPAERSRLILLWIGLGLLLMYAPVVYQRRFAFGVQPALAVLAGIGLVELNAWMRANKIGGLRRRLINYGVLLAAISTSLLVYLSLLASALLNRPAEVYLWSRPEATAATWLSEHSAVTDVVLASTEYANPLAGVIDGRVVHGHIVATLHSPQKEAQVQRFFSADASPPERNQLLKDTQATFVAFGPKERLLGATDVSATPGLELMYDAEGVQLFRVQS
jgi:asparagine N-glycosylation enzyme membrane subunit Stt3